MKGQTGLIVRGVPAIIGLGMAFLGITLLKNEKLLLHRRLELEAALNAKSRKTRRKLLLRES